MKYDYFRHGIIIAMFAFALFAPGVFAGWDMGANVSASSSAYAERDDGMSRADVGLGYGTENFRVEYNLSKSFNVKVGKPMGDWKIYSGLGGTYGHYSTVVDVEGVGITSHQSKIVPFIFVEAMRKIADKNYLSLRIGQTTGGATFIATNKGMTEKKTVPIQDTVVWIGLRSYF